MRVQCPWSINVHKFKPQIGGWIWWAVIGHVSFPIVITLKGEGDLAVEDCTVYC